ncbi:restriction endonuclease subunit S [Aliarcobacter cryaerophilus]|uniref:restriction endonuclease subunit S n=1 Tax=Aliarcobacter cryaerophilus TaxID=28198 RepID=UPI003BAF956B
MSKLPVGWELVTLESISRKMQSGGTPLSSNKSFYNGDIPFVKIDDITSSAKYLYKTKINITKEGLENSSAWIVPINSILYSMYASLGFLVINKIPVATNQAIMNIIPDSDKVELEYLYQFLIDFKNKINKFIDQTTQKNLNAQKVKNFLINLPPLEEQKKIADILSTVDKKIAFVEDNINATEELKKGLMQKLLTEGIGHTEFKDSELGRIPESWEIKRLNSICNKITDGSHFSPIPNKNTGFYIATVKDMLSNTFNINTCTHIEENDFKLLEINGCKPEIGDILFSKDGTIGKTFVYKDMKIPLVVLSSIAIIKPIFKVLDSLFTMHVLKSNIFYKQLNGLSSGSALKRVVLKAIKEIKIPFPPLEEQKQIAEILSTVDNKLENLKEKKQYFEELKKGLMQKLLTGEIRV